MRSTGFHGTKRKLFPQSLPRDANRLDAEKRLSLLGGRSRVPLVAMSTKKEHEVEVCDCAWVHVAIAGH